MDTRYANTIINVARGEAIPPPYGKVNDFLTEPGGDPKVRYGWKRLKEYFDLVARPLSGRKARILFELVVGAGLGLYPAFF